MYSAKIDGEATPFRTSGLLYRSNKLMYDRTTKTLWHQFTGEPVIGPLADSGMKLPFFPSNLTTWGEWLAEHPDTTVISNATGFYNPMQYWPEWDPRATYYDYFRSPDTRFPVWNRSDALKPKEMVLGLGIGGAFKAYPLSLLQGERVINDVLASAELVVIGSASSQASRAYERRGHLFSIVDNEGDIRFIYAMPTALVDSAGVTWTVTEEYLVNDGDPSQRLPRIPTHTSFWFGWYEFHPDTQVYSPDGE